MSQLAARAASLPDTHQSHHREAALSRSDCKIGANESSEASATPEDSTSMVKWSVGDSVDYEVIGPRQKRSRRRRRTRSLDATSPRARRDGSHRSTAPGTRATSRAATRRSCTSSTKRRSSSPTRSPSTGRAATTSRGSARAAAAGPRPPPKRRSRPASLRSPRRRRRPCVRGAYIRCRLSLVRILSRTGR